jgi:serine protease Do
MIRKTLDNTQRATYAVELPNPHMNEMPTLIGTGFFVSPDGWFVTAAHVVTQNNQSDGPVRTDLEKGWLMKESRPGKPSAMCQGISLAAIDAPTDFALLKVDFERNSTKDHLVGQTGFPFLKISLKLLEDGTPVYAFGYPLPHAELLTNTLEMTVGHAGLAPRVTSAIVASCMDRTQVVSSSQGPQVYVLDKALNYGNSGGPIVAVETGHVHALCSRFQPVYVPQHHLKDPKGNVPSIKVPSLYGIVSSLSSDRVVRLLAEHRVPTEP